MRKTVAITLAAILAVTPVHVYAEENTSEPGFLDKVAAAVQDAGEKVGETMKSAQTAAEQAAQAVADFITGTPKETDAPDKTAPDKTAPDKTAPDKTAPDETAPDETASDETASDNAPTVADKAGEWLNQVREGAQNAVNAAGGLISNSVKGAREAADALSHAAEETAANVSVMTKETAQKISKAAKDAIDNLTGAAYYVMDKAGNIISMVSETTIRVTDNARKAVDIIARFGPAIMEATKSSIAKLDLSDDRSEEVLNRSIRIALTGANRTGLLGKNITDETITIVSDVMTKAIVYGWRYSMGMITLKEYVSVMSEIIIKNGLPTGVGMLASLLPLDGASDIAYNATEYLVKKVYTEEQDENVISAASEAVPAAA